jgi:serine/threonine-protein kinase
VTSGQNDDTTRIPETPQAVVAPSTEMIAYSTGWERAELTAAAMALEPYVGPRARVLVKDAAERASSVKHLYRLLVESIPSARGREEFCRAQGIARDETPAAGNPASTTPPVVLDPVFLVAVEQLLAAYLGPLARVLVRQHAREQPSADLFLSRLAEELAVPQRREFLEAVRKVRGKF